MSNGRGDSSQRGVPRPFLFLALGVGLLSATLLGVSLAVWQIRLSPQLLLVFLAAVIAQAAATSLPGGGAQSLSYPLSVCALILFGPSTGALVAALSVVRLPQLRSHSGDRVIALFNAGQVLCAAILSGAAYQYLGGRFMLQQAAHGGSASAFTAADFPRMLPALVALALLSNILNTLLAVVGLATLHKMPIRRVLTGGVLALAPSQLALAFLGYGLAQVVAISSIGFILFVFPLVVSRQLFQNYLALREAYLESVTALVTAIEAKDPYTSGHSRRVAEYSVAIATALGLPDDAVERIQRSGLLHDLGKVAVSSDILNKPTFLSPSERLAINEHPGMGGLIAGRVPYLHDLADIIATHHERYDGTGYARGLVADAIPLEARVLAVADAFDAMTSARAYRDALPWDVAIEEIRLSSGSQFDPSIVEAFLSVSPSFSTPDADAEEESVV